jgi:hypothetical protein
MQYLEHGEVKDWEAVGREGLIGAVAGGSGVGAGKLLVKGATLLKATSSSKLIVNVASAATEGAVSATTSAGLKREPSDGAVAPAAGLAVAARGAGALFRRLTPKKEFSRPVRPKPVLEIIKKKANEGVPATVGVATENAVNAGGSAYQACGVDERCK